jgi:beta-lysine 5,6-aminomutase alpha subunit
VLDAAGNLHEDFRPAPGGFIQQRAHQVLDEAVDLLERIVDEPGEAPLLAAIADGTFGLMKRPADKGKGLDGVVAQADGYYNPATELLESPAPAPRGGRR